MTMRYPSFAFVLVIVAVTAAWGDPATRALRPAATQPSTVIYRWNAAAWLETYNQAQFTAVPITNADGTTGAQITVTPRDAGNPYNHIVVSAAGMKGGQQYTAAITFSVITPTTYPTSFYMFARNSAGNQYDIWRTWLGMPGATRTIYFPLDLKAIEGGTWKLYVGISKSGAIAINSLIVYSGVTSDGTTSYVSVPPVRNGTAVTTLPPGVTEASGFTPFAIAPPAPPTTMLSMANYNFQADAPDAVPAVAIANAAALQQALDDCKARGATTLVIPQGTYRLANAANLTLDDLHDVTIDGQHSRLICQTKTKEGQAFVISNCQRLILKDFTLDWDWNVIPIASLGTVSNLTADHLQCDFTFPDLDAKQTRTTLGTPWHAIFAMDAVHLTRGDVNIFAVPKGTTLQAGNAGNVIHATFPAAAPLANGGSYCIRHLYYDMSGFKVVDCSDLTFNGVDINSIPGMGWFLEGSMHDFQLVNCKILRATGSRHPLTTAADGIHVDEFINNLNIENCSITGTGDDAMNVHNESYEGNIVADENDPRQLTLVNCPSYQLRLKPGDPVEFYDADYAYLNHSPMPVTRQVATVASDNHGTPHTVIHFTETLPAGITPQSIVRNAKFATSNVRITGCNIEDVYGRGILLSAQNVLISACKLRNTFCTAINLESDIVQPLWTEGRGTTNVLITGNTFANNNPQGRYGGAVIYTDVHLPWGPTAATLYKGLSIADNHFVNCPGPALSLGNCDNVLVRGNEIRATSALANPLRNAGVFLITNSADLALGGNTWINEIPAPSPGGVIFDPATTERISTDTNTVTNPP